MFQGWQKIIRAHLLTPEGPRRTWGGPWGVKKFHQIKKFRYEKLSDIFQGSQKPARHLPDLVPSSCALAPRQTREAGFLVLPNFTNHHSFFKDGLWGFIFSGMVRIVNKSIFCFLTFSKFGHQVALRPLFTFSFLLVLTMFRAVLMTFFFLRWKIYIRQTYFEKIGGVLFFVYK